MVFHGTVGDRMDRLGEALRVIHSLWTQSHTSFDGKHYQLTNAVANPKPIQRPHPPIWIGGSGRCRTLRMVAEFADAWNASGSTPEQMAELSTVLDQHCADVGRDPAQIRRTVQVRLGSHAARPADLADAIEPYRRVGATEVIVVLAGGQGHGAADVERVGEQLPHIRALGT